ncbi:HEPACAM family member 2-like [Hemiscyllium ocellatum]|uniref:HEPACAM family member 2-like n=1 Tax=Hemiscyllium ocellatum TaxID=170820 RepID=UPI0029667B09|nr:HEPACAM family member 2-like [Hemiscyllium ocellatum]XP_060708579.1 HEPACAM family member 2-like [Hemiscyllium ocellatum]XP_060708580.1 HEPACAM family member 2-like [Hemiscyllium ocellatum]XP_060708581.1 HEPACAM family member 2-like [Hemiscyllium ocellatum]XP_060708582.1 HEPACAM family member 2-like [Hemiscyllium ocellatum]XP_060708583.1 HEPACAM family member 2-like [Hemiscyllium ocellatum]
MDIKGPKAIVFINVVLLLTAGYALNVNLRDAVIYGISGQPIHLQASYHVGPSNRLHSIIWKVDNVGATRILQYIVSMNTTIPSSPYRTRIQFDSETGSLRLSNFTPFDQGTYQITVTADDGAEDKASTQVTMYEHIAGVTVTMTPNVTNSMRNITLSCSVERGTRPEFSWTKDRKNITETERLSIGNSGQTLELYMLGAEDCGTYTCLVTNQLNNQTQSLSLSASLNFLQCSTDLASPKRHHYLLAIITVASGIVLMSLLIYSTKVGKIALQSTRSK